MLRILFAPVYLVTFLFQMLFSFFGIEFVDYKAGRPKFTFKYYRKVYYLWHDKLDERLKLLLRDFSLCVVLAFVLVFSLRFFLEK